MTNKHFRPVLYCFLCVLLISFLSACRRTEEKTAESAAAPAKISLVSPAFDAGSSIPEKYTCQGQDVSPPLQWSDVPEGAKSFALVVEDPDAPRGMFVHWVIYNILPSSNGLPEDVPRDENLADGAIQGFNGFHRTGYDGPCPPPGKAHRYFFKLYALNEVLPTRSELKEGDLMDLMKGKVVGQGELMGTFQR